MTDWLSRAKAVIPTGASTLSKRSRAYVEGSSPVAFTMARGCQFVDVEGQWFLDLTMGLGPYLLGYAFPPVVQAVCRAVKQGESASVPSVLEVEAAERLIAASPYKAGAQARWLNSGTEACAAAVRTARRATGRRNGKIVSSGYHGWLEAFMCLQPVTDGIPDAYRTMIEPFSWGDMASLGQALDVAGDVAAVILEPAIFTLPEPGYLGEVQRLTRKAGALLIFDEIVTGLRCPAATSGVVPDITVYGKAIGAGEQVGCIVGPAEILAKSDVISGTFCGSASAMAAVIAVLDYYAEHAPEIYRHIDRIGAAFRAGINDAAIGAGLPLRCEGMPNRMRLTWPDDEDYAHRSMVVEQLAGARIHVNQSAILPCLMHGAAQASEVASAMHTICANIQQGATLHGLPIMSAFQRDPQPTAAVHERDSWS